MQSITTDRAPAAIGPYSQAILAGGFVFVSGQLPVDPRTEELVQGSIAEQERQAIHNVEAVLHAAGSDLDHVVKTSCFLVDMADFPAFNEEYARHFTGNPARECIEVAGLPKGAALELSVIAVHTDCASWSPQE